MKNKLISLQVIFTLLLIISGALYLIYIFRNRENFDSGRYTWKYGEGLSCKGDLNTNTELQNISSYFNRLDYEKYSTAKYNKTNIKNPGHLYAAYCDIMSYNDLLAYKCLKISPSNLSKKMDTNDIKNIFETIYIYNESSLYSYLLAKIQMLTTTNVKLQGPIYVCMSQSPYLKYAYEKINPPISKWLDARIDILNNKNPYYSEVIDSKGKQSITTNTYSYDDDTTNTFSYDNNEKQKILSLVFDKAGNPSIVANTDTFDNDMTNTYSQDDKQTRNISSLYAQILIILPMYDKNMKLKKEKIDEQKVVIDDFLQKTISAHHTHNDMCFIKCNKSSTINCGCLNMNDNNVDSRINTFNYQDGGINNATFDFPRYTSKCIDHTNNNTATDFSMMYFVNPYSDNYINVIEDPDGEKVEEAEGDLVEGAAAPASFTPYRKDEFDGIQDSVDTAKAILTPEFYDAFDKSKGTMKLESQYSKKM
jgi:hypothetical protein